jgi:hypothetical protein
LTPITNQTLKTMLIGAISIIMAYHKPGEGRRATPILMFWFPYSGSREVA